jgi:diguanylate cyclase (GGDEF)-like protein
MKLRFAFGIAQQLGLLLALVGVGAAVLTGFYAYELSRDMLLQEAKSRLLGTTVATARRVGQVREEVTHNLQVLSQHPAAIAALQSPNAGAQAQVDALFRLYMQAYPGYFQIRLISAADYGVERVRVDRDRLGLLSVTGDDLQEKAHFAYVHDTLKLPAGATYLSRIVINHERGAHAGQDKPSVILAMPVIGGTGTALGVVVINVDLNGLFVQLMADLPKGFELLVANRQGDYLIHPDPSQTFGFDNGRRVLVQDEFAATVALVEGTAGQVLTENDQGRYASAPVVAAFVGRKVVVQSDETGLILGVTQPLSEVVAQANILGWGTSKVVIALAALCVLLALLIARVVARPIRAMGLALQRFAKNQQVVNLPVDRKDEIGMLARSFDSMQNKINLQMAQLQDSRQELEHLARHDMLTGLPNRRLFQERLEQALDRAQRHERSLAVLFIDLDHFKNINDDIGHDAGDAVLQAVANRLQAHIRKVDTVARLGGDAFVILLDDPVHHEQIASIADKLLDALKPVIAFGSHRMNIGASIGISLYPRDGVTAVAIMANADRAMYRAKADGRNGYHFFS